MQAPETWKIKDMVVEQAALAHLFERYGIDYCCNGNDTLETACAKKGLNIEHVISEIQNLETTRSYSFLHSDMWDLEFLVDYIVENHHRYLKETMPLLDAQLKRLITTHGEDYPYLKPVLMHFQAAQHEMEQHMRKEEMILFPYLKSLASAKEFGRGRPRAPFLSVGGPLQKLEDEHAEMAQVLARIRGLLSDFEVPPNACALHRSVIKGMQAFIKDTHQHVHLENNLLFARARALEESFGSQAPLTTASNGVAHVSTNGKSSSIKT